MMQVKTSGGKRLERTVRIGLLVFIFWALAQIVIEIVTASGTKLIGHWFI